MVGIVIAIMLWLAGGTCVAIGLGRFLADADRDPER